MKIESDGHQILHLALRTTIDDVFRKMDLILDGILSTRELSRLGKIIGNEELANITTEDLNGEAFENIS